MLYHAVQSKTYPAANYMLKVNNRNTRTRHWRRSDVFIVKFEHEIWSVSIVDFEQVIPGWV